MPYFDGTGPFDGHMTGKGRGYCMIRIPDGNEQPMEGFVGLGGRELTSAPFGPFGYGASRYRHRGGSYPWAQFSHRNSPRHWKPDGEAGREAQLRVLEFQAERIESILDITRKRIRKLETEPKTE